MKKLSFLAMALAAVVSYSCGEYDNAVDNGKTVFNDENDAPHETGLVATLQGTPGEEMTIGISTYEDDYYAIVSGQPASEVKAVEVKANNDLINSNSKKRTNFNFTVGDDGIVKIYGNSLIKTLYVDAKDKNLVVSLDQPKLAEVQYVQIANAAIDIVKVPALEKLTFLTIYRCTGLSLLDVSDAQNLDTLYVRELKESKLTNLDLSQNTNLENIWIQGKNISNQNELKYLDLSKNTKLIRATVNFNKLEAIKFGDSYPFLADLSLSGDSLSELNLDGSFPVLEKVTADRNKLTSIVVPTTVKTLNVANNRLTFATIPANATTYSPQADIKVASPVKGILDLSETGATVYTPNVTAYAEVETGKLKFTEKLSDVVVTMTNENFPALTLKTTAFDTAEPSDEVFSWSKDEAGEYIVGGTITSVPADDVAPYTHKIGYWQNVYATVVIDGTKESIAKPEYNYIRVDLDEPLKKGMKLSFTGFRYVLDEKNANLYLVFALPNYVDSKDYPDYIPGHFDYTQYQPTTYDWDSDIIFNNVFGTGLTPNKETRIVDETLEGVKSFKIARGQYAETPIYLTKIEITRK